MRVGAFAQASSESGAFRAAASRFFECESLATGVHDSCVRGSGGEELRAVEVGGGGAEGRRVGCVWLCVCVCVCVWGGGGGGGVKKWKKNQPPEVNSKKKKNTPPKKNEIW